MRTERPIVAVKLFNTENRSSVSAAIPISAGDGEPLVCSITSVFIIDKGIEVV